MTSTTRSKQEVFKDHRNFGAELYEENHKEPEYLLTDSQRLERLEKRMDELIKEQFSCTASMFDISLKRVIKEFEYIRGRHYEKCTKCNADMTMTICKHHPSNSHIVTKRLTTSGVNGN